MTISKTRFYLIVFVVCLVTFLIGIWNTSQKQMDHEAIFSPDKSKSVTINKLFDKKQIILNHHGFFINGGSGLESFDCTIEISKVVWDGNDTLNIYLTGEFTEAEDIDSVYFFGKKTMVQYLNVEF